MDHFNKDAEVQFTSDWWTRVTKDEAKLIAWLKKLYGTEIGGHDDYFSFLSKFSVDDRTTKIFTNIALDELKHGGLIENLLDARGHKLDPNPPQSEYWKEMDSNIVDLYSAAAVNYFGEALAAFRFEVIIDHKDTPADVKEILHIILPDEQFHRTTLKRVAGDETLERFQAIHDAAVARLKGS
jgi:hypothetical protein